VETARYLLPMPPLDLTSEKQAVFEGLYRATPEGGWVNYGLPYPKWQYLTYICDTRDLVLHGSQNGTIGIVEPRQAHGIKVFSDQRAIYATTDGIWVIYFAILDRAGHPEMTLFNSCFRLRMPGGTVVGPLYFSITHSVLLQDPWCEGAVYILPRQGFGQEAPQQMQGYEVIFPHWVSGSPATPVAKLRVKHADLPLLAQMHGHDNERLVALATANPSGFPWPEALVI
jgi:hypothetical protein